VPGQKELQALAQEQASQSHKTICINTYFKISYHSHSVIIMPYHK
jgi:hypothetical protein